MSETENKKEQILSLYKEGKSCKEVIDTLKISKATYYRTIRSINDNEEKEIIDINDKLKKVNNKLINIDKLSNIDILKLLVIKNKVELKDFLNKLVVLIDTFE